jgi:hypothetical protein
MNGIVTTGVKMLRPVQKWFCTALLAAVGVMLGTASQAKADFIVRMTSGTNVQNFVGVGTGTSIVQTVFGGLYDVNFSLTSNLPGNSLSGFASGSTASATLLRAPGAGETMQLEIDYYVAPFTSPGAGGAKMNLLGSFTYLTGPPNDGTFASFVGQAGNDGTPFSSGMSLPPGGAPLSSTALVSATTLGSFPLSGPNWIRGATFYLGGVLNYDFSVSGSGVGHTVSTQASTVATVVPAPPSAVVALSALPVLGLGWFYRRRLNGRPPIALA